MAKKATPPPPLGLQPRPGFENSRYPTIGKLDVQTPRGDYRSQISTASPIGSALLGRISDVPTPYKGYTASSGDRSRTAFSRALTDTSRNAMNRSVDKFNVDYQTQAEKSRADDILAQRQNASDRFRLENLFDVFGADVQQGYRTKIADLKAYQDREFKNADAKMAASILRMVGGFL
jgi:hypothetical protein